MIRIHEIDCQIDEEQNMQARTKWYKSWEYYVDYIKSIKSIEVLYQNYCDDHILIFTYRYKNKYMNALYKHKAYIMSKGME